MAKIEDLIGQIPDERLRKGIAAEVKALKKTKKFGLVFEEHLPETVRLPKLPVKPGEVVALKHESGNQLWRVKTIHKSIATCDRAVEGYASPTESNKEFPVSDLVVVRSFGDAIYPALVPVDRVERGGPDKPWHVLINADNFHALQLLLYCYEGKVELKNPLVPEKTGLEQQIVALEKSKANRLEPLRNFILQANQAEKWVSENNWLEMKSFLKKVGLNRLLRAQTLTVSFTKPFALLAETNLAVRSTSDFSEQCSRWWRRGELNPRP